MSTEDKTKRKRVFGNIGRMFPLSGHGYWNRLSLNSICTTLFYSASAKHTIAALVNYSLSDQGEEEDFLKLPL